VTDIHMALIDMQLI